MSKIKELKFICPECNGDILALGLEGYHSCNVAFIDEEGDFEYNQIYSLGYTLNWHCSKCGNILKDKRNNIITDNLEVVEWIKENCKQSISDCPDCGSNNINRINDYSYEFLCKSCNHCYN